MTPSQDMRERIARGVFDAEIVGGVTLRDVFREIAGDAHDWGKAEAELEMALPLADAALNAMTDPTLAEAERAAIVKWLRGTWGGAWEAVLRAEGIGAAHVPKLLADAIEAGHHLQPKD